ncbi:phosphatidylglycerol lysyltransferase domain-containing protein [Eubacterium sp.]|uniref:phosphatidylglycerol lysyltransferase domain-containing protein n=1 Tax=Eubacterium sp. TaxID=142586 RepID=UPI0026DF396D|nr:phosphatidylglycerol lysyltransferase domain-containing protein [Eubacterium sp.]MDO5433503.1 phosphatidylglycerol lysyltransferase domain-containing protein [Eubacterium sp.]
MSSAVPLKQKIQNLAIGITFVLAAFILVISFIPNDALEVIARNVIDSRKLVQRVLAVVLLLTVYNLYKRKRVAWVIAILLIALNLSSHLARIHQNGSFGMAFILCEAMVLLIFLVTSRDFNRPSDKHALKIGLIFAAMAVYAIILSAASIYFDDANVFDPSGGIHFGECVVQTLQTVFVSGDLHQSGVAGHPAFETFVFWFSWICIIVAIGFGVKPFLSKSATNAASFDHARELVKKYGQNPLSYLTLEDDKTLYFGQKVDGVVAYGTVDDVVVVNGDPICADADFPALLKEFKAFCENSAHSLVFMGITDYYLEAYKNMGLGTVKCGEEARFDLTEFTMKGGKIAKVRANVNKATKSGVRVFEYRPLEKRDQAIEDGIEAVSQDWLGGKNSGELAFTLGGIGLDNPMDRRYFYATDADGKIVGFIVFVPFAKMDGYLADVTRRTKDAPAGVNEMIMVEAFQKFKDEGIHYATMGLAPLANLSEGEEAESTTTRLLEYIYENLNEVYGFKNLYRAKVKYNPFWVPGYFAYMPKIMTPKMAYAIVKIQNPQGMIDYAKAFVVGKVKKEKSGE